MSISEKEKMERFNINLPTPEVWNFDSSVLKDQKTIKQAEDFLFALKEKIKSESIKFRLTEYLSSDIFGQFKAILLSDNPLVHTLNSEGKGSDKITANQGSEIVIDFMRMSDRHAIGEVLETNEFLLSSYAKNKDKPLVVIITNTPDKCP